MRNFDQRMLDSMVESAQTKLANDDQLTVANALRQSAENILPRNLSFKRRRQYLDEAHRLLIHWELKEAGGRYSLLNRYTMQLAAGTSERVALAELHAAGGFRCVSQDQLLAIIERARQDLEDEARRGFPSELPTERDAKPAARSVATQAPRPPTIASVGITTIAVYYAQHMEGRTWKPRADLTIAEATKRHFGLACSLTDLRAAVDEFFHDAERHENFNTTSDGEPSGSD